MLQLGVIIKLNKKYFSNYLQCFKMLKKMSRQSINMIYVSMFPYIVGNYYDENYRLKYNLTKTKNRIQFNLI